MRRGGLKTGLRVAAPCLASALHGKGATERRRTERAGVQDVRQRVYQIHKVSRLKWMKRKVSDTCLNFADTTPQQQQQQLHITRFLSSGEMEL